MNRSKKPSINLGESFDELTKFDLLSDLQVKEKAPKANNKTANNSLSFDLSEIESSISAEGPTEDKVEHIENPEDSSRHFLVLHALTIIRRSLNQVTRMEAGNNCKIVLNVNDWGGWPQLTLTLNDKSAPQKKFPCFRIRAKEEVGKTLVEFHIQDTQEIEEIALDNQSKMQVLLSTTQTWFSKYLEILQKALPANQLKLDILQEMR